MGPQTDQNQMQTHPFTHYTDTPPHTYTNPTNPDAARQTVENIFDLSFLCKERQASFALNEVRPSVHTCLLAVYSRPYMAAVFPWAGMVGSCVPPRLARSFPRDGRTNNNHVTQFEHTKYQPSNTGGDPRRAALKRAHLPEEHAGTHMRARLKASTYFTDEDDTAYRTHHHHPDPTNQPTPNPKQTTKHPRRCSP